MPPPQPTVTCQEDQPTLSACASAPRMKWDADDVEFLLLLLQDEFKFITHTYAPVLQQTNAKS